MVQNTRVHVVNKTNSTDHRTLLADQSLLQPLAPDNVRMQIRLVSLTANNLTYARMASLANWWDAFSVPSFLPSPYNDTTIYGIVPVWGFAEVFSSRIDSLATGTLLYGFWPSSTLPIDLQLTPTEPAGHYIDTTPHRQTMWSYYHRYSTAPKNTDISSPSLAAETIFKPLFECAHSLNAHVLGPLALHPAPQAALQPTWPHADLSSAAVISLSASGKTARAFNDAVLNTRTSGPKAFLAITSDPAALTLPKPASSQTETEILSYSAALATNSITFLHSHSKIVIVDFGARHNSLPTLIAHLRSSLPTGTEIIVVGVGGEAEAQTGPVDMAALMAKMAAVPERAQMNTSEVREVAVSKIGAEAYFRGVEEGFGGFCERGGCGGVSVEVGEGVEALEKGWARLCAGEAGSVGGLAFRL